MKTFSFLVFALFSLACIGSAQQSLVEEKAKSGEKFGEQALKAKSKAGTVGGNYRYGKKALPTELKESKRQAILKEQTAPPLPGKEKKGGDGTPLSTKDVAIGVGAAVAAPLLLLLLLGGHPQVQKEIAREQMLGRP